MNILLVYATHSSGTYVASEFVKEELSKLGHTVTVKEVQETNPDEFINFDLIILSSPSWMVNKKDGQPHEFFFPFFEKAKGKSYPNKRFALFGLGDKSYMHFCGAVDVLQEFVNNLQGKTIIEPLRINGFFYRQHENEEQIQKWVNSLSETIKTVE